MIGGPFGGRHGDGRGPRAPARPDRSTDLQTTMSRNVDRLLEPHSLEPELRAALKADKVYWQRNEAKVRAASDSKVASYDEFREIVAAAHLKPLEKKDKVPTVLRSVWNPASRSRNLQDSLADMELNENVHSCCTNSVELVRSLRKLSTPEDRFAYLKSLGSERIGSTFRAEIPVGVFGEILEAVGTFSTTTQDVVAAVSILEALTKTARFRLSLEFLSCQEKAVAKCLLDKLEGSLRDRQQDLAELGVTEWSVANLKTKYIVHDGPPNQQ